MKYLLLLLLLLFVPTTASAQCTGLFPDGTVCGNTSGTTAPPKPINPNTFGVGIDVKHANPPIVCDGTDQTANLVTLLTSLQNAGTGANLMFHACTYRFSNAAGLVFPNDGLTPPKQVAIKLAGEVQWVAGVSVTTGPSTIFDMRSSNALGQLQTYGLGTLELENITFTNLGNSTGTRFIYTTNTSVIFHNSALIGASDKCNSNGDQDGIVLGGTSTTTGTTGTNDAFQGYGTSIVNIFSDCIRRTIYGRVFANAIVGTNIFVSHASGSNFQGVTAISSVAAAGTGYNIGDFIAVTGGTFEGPAFLKVLTLTAGPGSGVATAAIWNDGNYTATPSNPVAQGSTSGGGSGATFNLTFGANGAAIELDGAAGVLANIGQTNTGWTIQGFSCEQTDFAYCIKLGDTTYNSVQVNSFDGNFGVNAAKANVHLTLGAQFNKVYPGSPVATALVLAQDDNGCSFVSGNFIQSTIQGDGGCYMAANIAGLTVLSTATFTGGVNGVLIQPSASIGAGSTIFNAKLAVADGATDIMTLTYAGGITLNGSQAGNITNANTTGASWSGNGRLWSQGNNGQIIGIKSNAGIQLYDGNVNFGAGIANGAVNINFNSAGNPAFTINNVSTVGSFFELFTNGAFRQFIGTDASWTGAGTAQDLIFATATAVGFKWYTNSGATPIATLSSGGQFTLPFYGVAGVLTNDAAGVITTTGGLSTTKSVRAAGGGSDCTLIYTLGVLTGGSC